MPKKTSYKSKPEFYETLAPSMAFSPALEKVKTERSTQFWIYPAWIGGSVILGVLIGLAVKDLNQAALVAIAPGNVAKISHIDFKSIASSEALAKAQNSSIQGNPTGIQGQSGSLQSGRSINDYQYSYNAYGLQGAVGVSSQLK